MARPREPIDLITAKGRKHLTKEEYENRKKSEIQPRQDDIKPPVFLQKNEKKKFETIAKELLELDIMSNLDVDILARYIRMESEYVKISREIAKIKFTADRESDVSQEGQILLKCAKFDKMTKVQNRLLKACNDCARELGLTISSRCKLVIPKPPDEKPKNKFLL